MAFLKSSSKTLTTCSLGFTLIVALHLAAPAAAHGAPAEDGAAPGKDEAAASETPGEATDQAKGDQGAEPEGAASQDTGTTDGTAPDTEETGAVEDGAEDSGAEDQSPDTDQSDDVPAGATGEEETGEGAEGAESPDQVDSPEEGEEVTDQEEAGEEGEDSEEGEPGEVEGDAEEAAPGEEVEVEEAAPEEDGEDVTDQALEEQVEAEEQAQVIGEEDVEQVPVCDPCPPPVECPKCRTETREILLNAGRNDGLALNGKYIYQFGSGSPSSFGLELYLSTTKSGAIGVGQYYLLSDQKLPSGESLSMTTTSGLMKYVLFPDKLIHASADLGLGLAKASIGKKIRKHNLFHIEPGINLEVNLTHSLKFALGVSYRWLVGPFKSSIMDYIKGVKLDADQKDVKEHGIGGFNLGVRLQYGCF